MPKKQTDPCETKDTGRMMIVHRRWRSMEKPLRKWMMIVTAKDDLGNRLGNGTGEVKLTIMLSRGGSREIRASRRS